MYYIVPVAIAIVAALLSFKWRVIVPTNREHVVRRNSGTSVYGKEGRNVYYDIPSWVPKFGVEVFEANINIFDIKLNNYEAYDEKKVPFAVDIMAYFQVENALVTSERVSSRHEMEEQLTELLRGIVRKVLASHPVEGIMGIRKELGETFLEEVKLQVKNWGVTANNIEFMDIRDASGSEVITAIMAKERTAIEKESRIEIANNNKIAELNEIQALEAVGQRDIERARTLDVDKQTAQQSIKEQEAITKEKHMAVIEVETVRQEQITKEQVRIDAEARRNVVEVDAEANRSQVQINARGRAEAARVEAEGYKAAEILKGEGDSTQTRDVGTAEAEVTLAKGMSEAKAKDAMAEALQKFNDAATGIEKLKVLETIGVAKFSALGEALSNADLKLVSSGQGGSLFGFDLNGENGADLDVFLEQLGPDGVAKAIEAVKKTVTKE